MAPPRIQCVNSLKSFSGNVPTLRATFSTTRNSRAEDDSRPLPRPSANDLLSSIGEPRYKTPTSFLKRPSGHKLLENDSEDPVLSILSRNRSQFPPSSSSDSSPPSYGGIKLPNINRRSPSSSFTLPPKPTPGNESANESATRLLQPSRFRSPPNPNQRLDSEEERLNHNKGVALGKQLSRRFRAGDVYAPHDLGSVEMGKWKWRGTPKYDAFDALDLNPIMHYKNFSMLSEYVSAMGRIKHRKETGLRPVNQRRIAKAIRRAIGLGLMPSVHYHPEIIQKVLRRNAYS